MVRFWRTAQRRVCFQKKKGCLFQEPLKEKKTTRKWFVSFLNRRTPQEGEEQEEKSFCFRKEPLVSRTQRKWFFFFFSEQKNTSRRRKTRRKKFLFQKKEEPLFFSSSFLWRKEPLKENGSFLKNRSKKWCFFLLLLCFALLCFALLCFACFKNSKKRCCSSLLVSRIQRNGAFFSCSAVQRKAVRKEMVSLVSRKEFKEKKTTFCFFVSRKEGFVSRTRRAAASCLFQEPLFFSSACFKKRTALLLLVSRTAQRKEERTGFVSRKRRNTN